MLINVEVKPEVALRFKNDMAMLERTLRETLINDLSIYAFRTARAEAPKRTGELANSIDVHVRFGYGFSLHAHAPYARMIHMGTGGGDLIFPRRVTALRYPDGRYGAVGPWKFSRVVVRGRISPNPFFERTREKIIYWLHTNLVDYLRMNIGGKI